MVEDCEREVTAPRVPNDVPHACKRASSKTAIEPEGCMAIADALVPLTALTRINLRSVAILLAAHSPTCPVCD